MDYDDFEYDFTEFLGEIMTELRKHKEECAPVIRTMRKITKSCNKPFDFDTLSNQIRDTCECMQSLRIADKYDNIYNSLISAICDINE